MLGMIKRQGSKLIVALLKAIPISTKIQHLPPNNHQRQNIQVVGITNSSLAIHIPVQMLWLADELAWTELQKLSQCRNRGKQLSAEFVSSENQPRPFPN
jgi:hypothetical protein